LFWLSEGSNDKKSVFDGATIGGREDLEGRHVLAGVEIFPKDEAIMRFEVLGEDGDEGSDIGVLVAWDE
jgi:hypothetical protein